ncbi:MAG: hypothetical protein ACON5B_02770 [Myxococcota bacterium]
MYTTSGRYAASILTPFMVSHAEVQRGVLNPLLDDPPPVAAAKARQRGARRRLLWGYAGLWGMGVLACAVAYAAASLDASWMAMPMLYTGAASILFAEVWRVYARGGPSLEPSLVQVREWAARQDAAAGERRRAELNAHATAEDVSSDDLYGLAIRLGILAGHDPFLRGRVDEAMRRRATLRKEIRDLEAAAAAEPTSLGPASESAREHANPLADAIATRRAMLDALGVSLQALHVELIRAEDEAIDGGLARASESVGRLEAELEVLAAHRSAMASRMLGS